MVQSKAATVDDWFEEVDPVRRPWFERVRALALRHLGPETEAMRWGLPTYARPGDETSTFAFNSQKQYLALYVPPPLVEKYAGRLGTNDAGKSCLRYRRGEQIPFDVLDRILAETAAAPSVKYSRSSKL